MNTCLTCSRLENKKKYNPKNQYESSFNINKMHTYQNFHINLLRQYEEMIISICKAREEGIQIEKSKKYSKILEYIKEQKSYERTIKMVNRLSFNIPRT